MFSFRRHRALAQAEIMQFLRNRTLLLMSLLCPIFLPLVIMYFWPVDSGSVILAGLAMEVFLLMTLMFVQFYSVLSMVATRRDEKVLKRLRTGEARDSEILLAIATPGAIVTLCLSAAVVAVVAVLSGRLPTVGFGIMAAVVFGIIISTAFALLTSSFTTNAEAAQITSMPVITLAVLSQSSIRFVFPQQIKEYADRTPFALLVDLSTSDWVGTGLMAENLLSVGYAALWSVVLCCLAIRYLRWETKR